MTSNYPSSMQSSIGNSNQKAGNIVNNNNCRGQQFVVNIASDQSNNNNSNGEMDHSLVAHNNIIYQQQIYPEYPQTSHYTTIAAGGYYEAPGSTQIMNHGGETFIVHHGLMENETTATLPHTVRAAPASVQWLHDNYEPCEGVSLPRSTLYNHYLFHCCQSKLDPMNPASFGKLIRAVFPNLKTRRLGTRGNSQYHYQGIRVKSVSSVNQIYDHFASPRATNYHHHHHHHNQNFKRKTIEDCVVDGEVTNSLPLQNNQDFLGDVPPGATDFGEIEIVAESLTDGLTPDDVHAFETLYRDHCERIMETVVNMQFKNVESIWRQFWGNRAGETEIGDSDLSLGREKMTKICRLPRVVRFVRASDCRFYQALVAVLIPDVLRPIPCSLTQSIRNFAKYLTEWMVSATIGLPEPVINVKVEVVKALVQTLRRHTSLNHLAQAARAVLQNPSQVAQMLADINKIDFNNVQEQASWVCECDPAVVTRLEQDFKKILQQQTSLEQWASWLDDAVSSALNQYSGESATFVRAAKRFLVNWSYYSSLVIRDLTLRSAASFGSFHLIHLLYNEYIFYLVERKVASASGETSISVMCPEVQFVGEMFRKEKPEKQDDLLVLQSPASSRKQDVQFLASSASSSTSHVQPANPAKTVSISFGGQKPYEPGKAPGGTPARMTLMPSGQQCVPKTIIVVPVSSLPSNPPSSLNPSIVQLPSAIKQTKHDWGS